MNNEVREKWLRGKPKENKIWKEKQKKTTKKTENRAKI